MISPEAMALLFAVAWREEEGTEDEREKVVGNSHLEGRLLVAIGDVPDSTWPTPR